MERGVIANPIKIGMKGTSPSLTESDIRFFLLYWDKIVIPSNNIINAYVPDEDILMEQGFLVQPCYEVNESGFGAKLIFDATINAQVKAVEHCMENSPEIVWGLHQFSNELILGDGAKFGNKSLQITLNKMLPLPDGEVPIVDVIDFKNRRKDLLDNFHVKMEDIYIEAIKNPDVPLGHGRAVKELQQVLGDLNRVATEKWRWINRISWSPSLNLDVPTALAGVGAVYEFYKNQAGFNLEALGAGILGMLSIQAKLTSTTEWTKNNPILAYLTAAHDEEILS